MSSDTGALDARPAVDDEMPPALASMWRLLKLGYRHEPWLLAVSFALTLAAALPDALLALWLSLLAEGVTDGDRTLVFVAAVGLGAASTLTWFLRVVSTRVQRRFRDKVTIALESHVAELQATVATIAHQERPDHLDRLSVLRNQVFVLDHMYMSVFSTAGWILRLAVTVALLASIHPALILLAVLALPTVVTSTWRPGVERVAEEKGASHERMARHLFQTATTAPPGKEVRVTGIGPRLVAERRDAWEAWYEPVSQARWGSALWHTLAWLVFGLAYVGAIVFVAAGLDAGPGRVLLVLAAGSRLSAYIGATVGEIGFLRGVWLDGSRRLAWLEDYAAALVASADLPVPDRLTEGIRLDHVSFAYPGTDRLVLDDIDLVLPAGAVVAVVGENGAGKTTLVKLLAKLYEPTSGAILVDGAPLARMPADDWRERMAGAFQDFFRFELAARHSVGLGDVPRLDDVPAVSGAIEQAGAEDLVTALPGGLETQLGPTWPEGVEVSFGQWQKLALARGFMRNHPLLLVLDEPTAALDAETEHALFERYAAAARRRDARAGEHDAGADQHDRHRPPDLPDVAADQHDRPPDLPDLPDGAADRHDATADGDDAAADGRITILVSHRFSTVRMADLIVVLDGSRLVEVGTHDDLVAADGTYASLYGIQAAAYR